MGNSAGPGCGPPASFRLAYQADARACRPGIRGSTRSSGGRRFPVTGSQNSSAGLSGFMRASRTWRVHDGDAARDRCCAMKVGGGRARESGQGSGGAARRCAASSTTDSGQQPSGSPAGARRRVAAAVALHRAAQNTRTSLPGGRRALNGAAARARRPLREHALAAFVHAGRRSQRVHRQMRTVEVVEVGTREDVFSPRGKSRSGSTRRGNCRSASCGHASRCRCRFPRVLEHVLARADFRTDLLFGNLSMTRWTTPAARERSSKACSSEWARPCAAAARVQRPAPAGVTDCACSARCLVVQADRRAERDAARASLAIRHWLRGRWSLWTTPRRRRAAHQLPLDRFQRFEPRRPSWRTHRSRARHPSWTPRSSSTRA